MKAKEKAKEFIEKFSSFADTLHNENRENAKQCALIAVKEIQNVIRYSNYDMENYWEEVKKEIEKL